MKLSEDDLYRTSTQFQHWSFTPASLTAQRINTNHQATARVKANVARQRAQRLLSAASSSDENTSGANTPLPDRSADVKEVDCLNSDEEMMLVDEFCERALALGTHCGFPNEVAVRMKS